MKTVIFGLDGGTFRVLDRYRSKLPTLDRLLESGYCSELNSTYPATTSVAWPALATGQNPAKFGLADFMYRDPATLEFKLNDARRKSFDFFWEYMNESIGLASVPIIPYHHLDGFFIQGSLAHVEADQVTKPHDLRHTLPEYYNYNIDWRDGPQELIDGLLHRISDRENVFTLLANRFDIPLYFFEFDAIDRIQHHCWAYMDETHPNYVDSEYSDAILEIWQRVDEAIASILAEFEEDLNVIVVSDHGFRPSHTEVNIAAVLREEGFLKYNLDETDSLLARVIDMAKKYIGRENLNKIVPRILQQKAADSVPSHSQIGNIIEWDSTEAYCFGVMANVFLNVESREKHGTVSPTNSEKIRERVAESLESTIDEKRGTSPIHLKKKEEIYSGPYIDYMPDLVVETQAGYKPKSDTGKTVFNRQQGVAPNSGVHEREGIFIVDGPAFKSGGRADTPNDIVDVGPTILHMYGYAVPASMDGDVITSALKRPEKKNMLKSHKGERQRVRNRVLSLKQLGEI